MSTIQEFIQRNLGRPNVTPKGLIMEAYAMGIAHGKGEEYAPEQEEVEEEVEEVEEEEPAYDGEEDETEKEVVPEYKAIDLDEALAIILDEQT